MYLVFGVFVFFSAIIIPVLIISSLLLNVVSTNRAFESYQLALPTQGPGPRPEVHFYSGESCLGELLSSLVKQSSVNDTQAHDSIMASLWEVCWRRVGGRENAAGVDWTLVLA